MQINAQINNHSVRTKFCELPCFSSFFKILKSDFLIQDLLFRLIVNENGISMYQNLRLGVDNQKQVRFRKLKMLLLFDGSLNTIRFFYSLSIEFLERVCYTFSHVAL